MRCSACGIIGVKLWRDVNAPLEKIEPVCGPCFGPKFKHERADKNPLGSLVPAIYAEAHSQRAVLRNEAPVFWRYRSAVGGGFVGTVDAMSELKAWLAQPDAQRLTGGKS